MVKNSRAVTSLPKFASGLWQKKGEPSGSPVCNVRVVVFESRQRACCRRKQVLLEAHLVTEHEAPVTDVVEPRHLLKIRAGRNRFCDDIKHHPRTDNGVRVFRDNELHRRENLVWLVKLDVKGPLRRGKAPTHAVL